MLLAVISWTSRYNHVPKLSIISDFSEAMKPENVVWKLNYFLTNENLLRMRSPSFPFLMQEENVQTNHVWQVTIWEVAISVAQCLPSCPGLCTHSVDTKSYCSFTWLHFLQGSQGEVTLVLPKSLCQTCSIKAWTRDIVLGPRLECKMCTVIGTKCLTIW